MIGMSPNKTPTGRPIIWREGRGVRKWVATAGGSLAAVASFPPGWIWVIKRDGTLVVAGHERTEDEAKDVAKAALWESCHDRQDRG